MVIHKKAVVSWKKFTNIISIQETPSSGVNTAVAKNVFLEGKIVHFV